MARKSLGIVLLLIVTSGCAGLPWRAASGPNDLAAVITPGQDGQPAQIPSTPVPSTPGFLPVGDSTLGSPTPGRSPTWQQFSDQPPRNQPPGGESLRQQRLNGSPYGQQVAAPALAAMPGSSSTPFHEGSRLGMPPGFQQYLKRTVADEVRRQNFMSTPPDTSKENLAAFSPSDAAMAGDMRNAEFNINDVNGVGKSALASTYTSPIGNPSQKPNTDLSSNLNASQPTNADPRVLDSRVVQASHTSAESSESTLGQWRDAATETLSSLNMDLSKGDLSSAERTRLNVMARLLHAFLNDSEKALAPIEDIDEDESEYWKHFAHSLIISLDADEKNTSSRRSTLTLRSLRVALDHLANISKLDVRNLAFCSKVESYGRFDEFKTYGFKPGQEVLLYVEVENFAVESNASRHETELQGEYTIFNVDGKRVASAGFPLDKQFSKNRRHDYFIAYRVFMPKNIEQGHHTLQLTIEDVKGSKSNQSTIEFWIR